LTGSAKDFNVTSLRYCPDILLTMNNEQLRIKFKSVKRATKKSMMNQVREKNKLTVIFELCLDVAFLFSVTEKSNTLVFSHEENKESSVLPVDEELGSYYSEPQSTQ
jgi:hypothetical protein